MIVCPSENICTSRIACVFNARFSSEAALIFVIKLPAEIVFVNTLPNQPVKIVVGFTFFIVWYIYKVFATLRTVSCFKYNLTL